MKKTIKFFSRTPTAINSKSHSAVQTTNEYTKDAGDKNPAVAQQSESIEGLRALEAKVDALTSIVEKVVNQGVAAKVPDAKAIESAVAQNSVEAEGDDEAVSQLSEGADNGDEEPEGIPEENLGAQVPANEGTYTEVPEDDIVKQFSKAAGMTTEEANSIPLAGKESFSCLF